MANRFLLQRRRANHTGNSATVGGNAPQVLRAATSDKLVASTRVALNEEAATIAKLRKLDEAYYNTNNPLMTDDEYNKFRADAKRKFGLNPYFKEVGTKPARGAVNLPLTVTRMGRIRSDSVAAWLDSVNESVQYVHYSHKIDGLFCLLHYRRGELLAAYTRGNDSQGQDITRFVKRMASVPKKIAIPLEDLVKAAHERPTGAIEGDAIFGGELCVSWGKYDAYHERKDVKADNKLQYASPRAMAQAAVNRNDINEGLLSLVDLVAHGVIWPEPTNPDRAWQLLKALFPIVSENGKRPVGAKTGAELGSLYETAKEESEYPIDGFVLQSSDGAHIQQVAMKREADKQTIEKTTVTKVEVTMSMRNLVKPVIHIKPVTIDGYKISTLTGDNMLAIEQMKIGPGSVVNVVRANDVIPHMLKTPQYKPTPSKQPFNIYQCPDCGGELSWTITARGEEGADLHCTDETCLKAKRTGVFFERLNVKGIGDASLEKLTFDRSVRDVLELTSKDFENELGKVGPVIRGIIHSKLSCGMDRIMYASGIFSSGTQSLGENTLAAILAELKNANITPTKLINGQGREYDGIDLEIILPPTSASRLFISRLGEFRVFYQDFAKHHEIPHVSDQLSGYVFTFSGFRDSDLVEKIRGQGGVYADSLSKKTTHLVSLNMPEPAKRAKAEAYGTNLMKVAELRNILNGYDSIELVERSPTHKNNRKANSEAAFLHGNLDRSKDRLPNKLPPPPFANGSEKQWPHAEKMMREYQKKLPANVRAPAPKGQNLLERVKAYRASRR